MGASFFTIPPRVLRADGFECRLTIFTPSTNTLDSSGYTSFTLRGFLGSLSSPVITTTLSPFLILNLGLNLLLIFLCFSPAQQRRSFSRLRISAESNPSTRNLLCLPFGLLARLLTTPQVPKR